VSPLPSAMHPCGRADPKIRKTRRIVMATGAVVCLPFEDDVESPVAGQTAKGRSTATRRSRWCGALLGDRVAAVYDQVLPGDVGGSGAGQPGNGGGDLVG
jgi:hypothetical protein